MSWLTGPTPPDPAASASAQTSANISTAIANSFLNNPNQVTPQGSLTYTPSGDSVTVNDPEKPGVQYTIPRYQATQTLSPNQQQLNTQREGAQIGLATTANTQAARLNQLLGGNVSLAGADALHPLGDPNLIGSLTTPATAFEAAGFPQTDISGFGTPQSTFGDVGSLQSSFGATPGSIFGFGGAGDITRSYGPQDDFSSDRARVEQALYGRLNPQLERERSNIEQRLQDQGIRYGSPAYQRAMDDYNRQANDMRLAVTQTAGEEQKRLVDMAAQRAGFQNAAQMQEYQQQQGRGQFYNAAEQQAFNEAAARGQFGNAAQQAAYQQALGRGQFGQQAQQSLYEQLMGVGQFANAAQAARFQQAQARGQFGNAAQAQELAQRQAFLNAQNQTRNQYLAELYAQRNQPINEISALLSGSQLTQPTWANWNQSQIPTTDIAGLINQNFSQQSANAQMQSQLLGNVIGAAGRIGSSAALLSDRREKDVGERMGSVFAADGEGERKVLPIYEFAYKDDPASMRHVGPMAQDVEQIDKGAVKTIRGRKYLKPDQVMGSIMRAA